MARDDELDVDVGKHFRLVIRTQCRDLDAAVRDVLTPLTKDLHDIKGGTTADPYEYKLHRPNANVVSTILGGSIHLDVMTGFGSSRKPYVPAPLNCCSHIRLANHSDYFPTIPHGPRL